MEVEGRMGGSKDKGWMKGWVNELMEGWRDRCVCVQYPRPYPPSLLCSSPHQGDSGGPLLYNGVAVGITSNGGKKCGQLKKPGIYTIISRYTQWIDRVMLATASST